MMSMDMNMICMAFGLETQSHLRGLVHGLGEPPGGPRVINFFA